MLILSARGIEMHHVLHSGSPLIPRACHPRRLHRKVLRTQLLNFQVLNGLAGGVVRTATPTDLVFGLADVVESRCADILYGLVCVGEILGWISTVAGEMSSADGISCACALAACYDDLGLLSSV